MPPIENLEALIATPQPPELGPDPRSGVQAEAELRTALDEGFRHTKLSEESRQLVRALVLLWHDHLHAAHRIVQAIETPDGSLVHAIMHRREPDYWNSKYWWRRVGQHPCFPELAKRVTAFLESKGEPELLAKLVPSGGWDPFAFVDACEATAGSKSEAHREILREVQRIETEVALAHFLGGDGS